VARRTTFTTILASRSLQHQSMNTLAANPNLLHQWMEKALAKH